MQTILENWKPILVVIAVLAAVFTAVYKLTRKPPVKEELPEPCQDVYTSLEGEKDYGVIQAKEIRRPESLTDKIRAAQEAANIQQEIAFNPEKTYIINGKEFTAEEFMALSIEEQKSFFEAELLPHMIMDFTELEKISDEEWNSLTDEQQKAALSDQIAKNMITGYSPVKEQISFDELPDPVESNLEVFPEIERKNIGIEDVLAPPKVEDSIRVLEITPFEIALEKPKKKRAPRKKKKPVAKVEEPKQPTKQVKK